MVEIDGHRLKLTNLDKVLYPETGTIKGEVVDYYGERTGWSVDRFDFHEVFGLFRLQVIVQQIYRRFALGQTSNPQFAGFGDAAKYLALRCRRRIAASGL